MVLCNPRNGGYLTELVQLEQDLAVGTDEDGIKISKGIFEGVTSPGSLFLKTNNPGEIILVP